MTVNWGDIAGLTGAALQLVAFAMIQFRRLDPHRPAALALNLFGSGLLIVSLLERLNPAAFLLESAWGAIACGGLIRVLIRKLRCPADRIERSG